MEHLYKLPRPDFDSELVELLFEIERRRPEIGKVTTPLETYRDLHFLFDYVMSIVSARIEGNHTTIYEALSQDSQDNQSPGLDHRKEIINILRAARHIDDRDPLAPLTHDFVRELHHMTVDGLHREGDPNPGEYREVEVRITGSDHIPPPRTSIHAEMTQLLEFSNKHLPLKEQMLQVALTHHRFAWIHPFQNGNGRVSRLFTYAMLRKTIFSTQGYSALNPTSVFGNSRADYVAALEKADSLSNEGSVAWATFFARGIRDDIERVITLQDQKFVANELILPTLEGLVTDGIISKRTAAILSAVFDKGVAKSADLEHLIPGSPAQRSRALKSLVDEGYLAKSDRGPRFYRLSLTSSQFSIRLVRQLNKLGYLPKMLEDD